jgi:Glycosyltransferase
MKKIIRITTISGSLRRLLQGQLRFMNKYFEVVGIASPGEAMVDVIKNEGIRTIPIEMTRSITPFKDLISLYQLYKVLKKEKPQIVHSHTPKAGTLAMIAARMANVPHRLHTVAGMPLLESSGVKRRVLELVEIITYSFSTKVYFNSLGLYNFVISKKYVRNLQKIKMIANGSSNGINTAYFDRKEIQPDLMIELKKEIGISDEDFVYISVGRLVKDKGINELIISFKKINEKYPNTKLLLLGKFERELDPLLNSTEVEIENSPSIKYMGYQMDVRPFYAISDVLVFPSYREGFPNVVMQAGAMGLPSIVTDINGCNEIIIKEKNGLIIPPKNIEKLFSAMETMLLDHENRKFYADNARDLIKSRYEQSKIWEWWLSEYKSL